MDSLFWSSSFNLEIAWMKFQPLNTKKQGRISLSHVLHPWRIIPGAPTSRVCFIAVSEFEENPSRTNPMMTLLLTGISYHIWNENRTNFHEQQAKPVYSSTRTKKTVEHEWLTLITSSGSGRWSFGLSQKFLYSSMSRMAYELTCN